MDLNQSRLGEGAAMNLITLMIPKILDSAPGRYILYDSGNFRMKEADGEDVKLTENGREYLVEPTADQIDDLVDSEQLVQEATIYRLPSKD
jgi:hypothetical protein